jgi:1-acyl-sn-glycerol-3-phosphate acyltransferase
MSELELNLRSNQNRFSQSLAKVILRLVSWKLDVTHPPAPKYVLIGAPHTSGWDLFYALLLKYGSGIEMHWMGKDTLFRWPLGVLLRWLGGIPVNRRSRNNFVQQVVDVIDKLDEVVIAMAPEGTRSKTKYWKTGFYYIASGADVPIALGFIDYGNRVVGIGPTLTPSDDIQADFQQIKAFYAGIDGRYPELQGEARIDTSQI